MACENWLKTLGVKSEIIFFLNFGFYLFLVRAYNKYVRILGVSENN